MVLANSFLDLAEGSFPFKKFWSFILATYVLWRLLVEVSLGKLIGNQAVPCVQVLLVMDRWMWLMRTPN